MRNQYVYFLLFCVSFGEYSCWIINSEIYEEIINNIGRQFFSGLCKTLDGNDLLGIECDLENVTLNNQTLNYYRTDENIFYPMVHVDPLGTAVGSLMKTYTDKTFYSFMGIRFATAKTFEMPVIYEESWDDNFMGGFDATYIRNKCPQSSIIFPVATGDEDCLFLNVYTPELNEQDVTRKYPVMVFIHGGSYLHGDTSLYVPSRLIEQDVIVVVIQYRLSILGFLYSATTSAPGNMGLMDQITALRWVKKYIKYFNGDEENVTVFGESAGGACTSFMQFTPQTSAEYNNGTQLLNRIIAQSGSALEVWTLDREYHSSLILHGEAVGCYHLSYTPDDIVACMKDLPTDQLIISAAKVMGELMKKGQLPMRGGSPVIQDELIKKLNDESLIRQYVVIPNEIKDMMADGNYLHVDVMSGFNRDEGSMITGIMYSSYIIPNGFEDDVNFYKYDLIPTIVSLLGVTDTNAAFSNSLRLGFLPNVDMGNSTQIWGGLIDLTGMLFFKSGTSALAQMLTSANPGHNFLYSFEFQSSSSFFDWVFIGYPNIPFKGGVSHGDELMYFFALFDIFEEREKANTKKMTTLWSNFAYFGDPTPDVNHGNWMGFTDKWLPYSFKQENFLLMTDDFVLSEDIVLRWNYNIME